MYGKHFQSMYTGSMVGKGSVSFAVWGYVIANHHLDLDEGAQVELNPKLLAFILGEDQAKIEAAIQDFCAPDPTSRTKDAEGRKLIKVGEFDYRVVNGAKYHDIKSEDDRRRYNRFKKRESRERSVGSSTDKNHIFSASSRVALLYLGHKTGKHFREVDGNLAPIDARLREEGVDLDGVKAMIDRQVSAWAGTKMADFLRPTTLFDKDKFDSYYAARSMPVESRDQAVITSSVESQARQDGIEIFE
jgi:uncharacterized phage protein (TIGR02220 family)